MQNYVHNYLLGIQASHSQSSGIKPPLAPRSPFMISCNTFCCWRLLIATSNPLCTFWLVCSNRKPPPTLTVLHWVTIYFIAHSTNDVGFTLTGCYYEKSGL
jgi:hypothetical protein